MEGKGGGSQPRPHASCITCSRSVISPNPICGFCLLEFLHFRHKFVSIGERNERNFNGRKYRAVPSLPKLIRLLNNEK